MKRFLIFALFLACLVTLLVVSVSAETFTGQAVDAEWIRENEGTGTFQGSDISTVAPNYRIWYTLDTDTGVLRIYHKDTEYKTEQEMLPYAKVEWIPWLKSEHPNVQRPYIMEAHIEEDVLRLGHYSFYECENLRTVYLPSSIYKIDQTVFYGCSSLETIYYAGTQEDFEKYVHFDQTRNEEALGKFVFGESVTVIVKNQHGEKVDEYIVGGYRVGDSYSFTPKKYDGMTFTGDPNKVYSGTFVENDQTVYELIYECDHEYLTSDSAACLSYCTYCKHANPKASHVFNEEGTVPCEGKCLLCNEFYTNADGYHVFDVELDAEHPENNLCRYTCSVCKRDITNEELNGVAGKHNKIEVNEPNSLFKGGQSGWKCSICGANELEGTNAYIFYIGIGAVAVAACVVIFLAIYLPIRRHKKIKDMTW